jgi:methionyl-tRNA formyltransferase
MSKHADSCRATAVFFGTPDFALPSLEAAVRTTKVMAVVTQPDRPRGRGQKLSACPVKTRALELGLKVFSPASLKKESPELAELKAVLMSERPDYFFVTAYGNLLPQGFLDLPKMIPINVHASLLPKWRGAAPIQRSLEAGDEKTGVCLQRMVMELDAGNVLLEASIKLSSEHNAESLSRELSVLGGILLERFMREAEKADPGSEFFRGIAQAASQISIAPKISKDEGFYRLNWSAQTFHNKVRAFRLWPKVEALFCSASDEVAGLRLKILKTAVVTDLVAEQRDRFLKLDPGQILIESDRVLVKCAEATEATDEAEDGRALCLLEVQPENRGPVEASSYFQNHSRKTTLLLKPVL